MSRRPIFNFPDVYNQILAGGLKIDLHHSSYCFMSISSYNTHSPAQTKPQLTRY